MLKHFSFFIFVFLFTLTPVFAESSEELTKEMNVEISEEFSEFLNQPKLVPGSPFYFVKKFMEGVGDLFTVGEVAQAKRNLEIAKERLSESNVLLERGQIDKASEVVKEFSKRLDQGGEVIEKLKEDERTSELISQLSESTEDYNKYFQKVLEKLPVKLQDDFKNAFFVSDKWKTIADSIQKEALKRLEGVGENILRTGEIKKEIETELQEKLKKEEERSIY